MVERRPTDVVPGPRVRLALAAIVFDFVNPLGLPNKLLLGLAAPALPTHTHSNRSQRKRQKKKVLTSAYSRRSQNTRHVINRDEIESPVSGCIVIANDKQKTAN